MRGAYVKHKPISINTNYCIGLPSVKIYKFANGKKIMVSRMWKTEYRKFNSALYPCQIYNLH